MLCQNLIQNGSFESYVSPIDCNGGGFDNYSIFPVIHVVNNWYPVNSPDYFNTACTTSWYNVPNTYFGDAYAKTGNAYAGIGVFDFRFDYQEYVYQQLTSPLKADSVYCLNFHVTRADRFPYAIKQIGAFFSNNLPSLSSGYINATPQVLNNSGFITDTVNWVEIQGCFTAQGGEEYITIGNFNSNANTDTLRIQSVNPLTGIGTDVAYYYIDSVSLWKNNFPTGFHEMGKAGNFMLYPNPNNGLMYLTYELSKKAELVMTDITGRLVSTSILDETQRSIVIKEQELSAGIYFYTIKQNQQILKQEKIVIIK